MSTAHLQHITNEGHRVTVHAVPTGAVSGEVSAEATCIHLATGRTCWWGSTHVSPVAGRAISRAWGDGSQHMNETHRGRR